MKTIDKLAWIQIKEKAILSTKSFGKDKYFIPGGKREAKETDLQALTREIKEELSVDIKNETVRLLGVFVAQAHGHPKGTAVRMTCYVADFIGDLKAASEIEEIKWLKYDDKDNISEVDKLIFDFLQKKGLID